jgi:hypothetical protein
MGKKKAKNDPYHKLSDSSESSEELNTSSPVENQGLQMLASRSAPSSPLTTKNEGLTKKSSATRRKHSRSKSADEVEADYILPSTQAVLDDLREASVGGFPQFESDTERSFPLVRNLSSGSKKSHSSVTSEDKPSASAINYFASLPPPPPPKGILRLAKKNKKQQKIQSSGVVNYGISGNSDSESETSSISVNSEARGYALPYGIQTSSKTQTTKKSNVSDSSNSDDELSVRTPIPKAPPDAASSVMPSAFLRDHHTSSNESQISDLSEEEESVAKRHKRELENVGRLVQAAKQQQSFAQAWFSAGKGDNVLPQLQPRSRNPRKSLDERSAGPIDVDSGESWEEPGSFTYDPSIQKSKGFITFGGGGDDNNKCCGRVMCTVGKTRCTLWAFALIVIVIIGATAGSTIAGIMLYPNTPDSDKMQPPTVSSIPTVSLVPSISPSYSPTNIPTDIPSVKLTVKPSAHPSLRPSRAPSQSPSASPSRSPSHFPSRFPSFQPTNVPSILPSLSQQPSLNPTNSPSTFFSTATFEKVGGDVQIVDSISNDRSGQSVKLSKDGNIMIIGSLRYPDLFGSVIVYERLTSESSWIPKGQRLDGSQVDSGTGEAVDISDDGTRIVISEYGTVNGTVKVYDYNNDTSLWLQVGDNIEGDGGNFGFSLSLSGDGQRVAVGAHAKGIVIVYSLDENFQWKQIGETLSNSYFGGNFGWSVSLSKNGEVLAIGAPDAAGDTNFLPEGFVEVYEYRDINWILRGTQLVYGEVFSLIRFGFSVSLNEDGSFLAVGANQNSFMNQFLTGSVTVYNYNSAGIWQPMGEDLLGIPSSSQEFGYSVSLSRNGKQVAVGAPYSGAGKVFIYRYNGIIWDESRVLEGENANEFFGFSVDVMQDDTSGCLSLVAIGAPGTTSTKGVTRTYQVNYVGPCPVDL